ncbi:MAG: MOSC domain-containing protein [bacterium]
MFFYPVKSCRGISLDAASLDRRGIVDDRRLMIVDDWARFISQRSHPRLALVAPRLHDGCVTLAAPGMPPLSVPVVRQGATRTVVVWNDECEAVDQGREASEWLSTYLEARVDLVRMDDRFIRPVDSQYAVRKTDEVSFADAYPLLVISEESLEDLNARLAEPVPMNRFRPNIVVRGGGAFAEDHWRRVRFGEVNAAIVKPCARCSTTTVDQDTAARGKEPLRTLATYRHDPERDVLFGQNVIHAAPGTIRVGDVVDVAPRA